MLPKIKHNTYLDQIYKLVLQQRIFLLQLLQTLNTPAHVFSLVIGPTFIRKAVQSFDLLSVEKEANNKRILYSLGLMGRAGWQHYSRYLPLQLNEAKSVNSICRTYIKTAHIHFKNQVNLIKRFNSKLHSMLIHHNTSKGL